MTHDPWQIHQLTRVLENPLGDDKPPLQRPTLPLGIPLNTLQHPLQILHIIRLEPLDRRPGNLHTLLDPEIDGLVDDDDVPSLGKGGDDRGNGGE